MGGNAFAALLPDATFPRMSPELYRKLKHHLTTRLECVYTVVAVPREAPEKADYGDLDFVVCNPHKGVTPEEVRETIGAREAVVFEGNRMSNFAIPADTPGEDTTNVYHQVDVRVCADAAELERVVVFNSYGDLGMIMGLLAKANQLSLGSSGLRLAKPLPTTPPCTFYLSLSFADILAFFGLSLTRWIQGFTTQREIFDWVASSPHFDIWNATRKDDRPLSGKMGERQMYRNFMQYARQCRTKSSCQAKPLDLKFILSHFGKQDLYDALLYVARTKQHIKAVFSGKQVEVWTQLLGPPVGIVMEEVRQKLGGNDVLATVCGVDRTAARDNDIDPIHLTLKIWEEKMGGMNESEVRDVAVQITDILQAAGELDVSWKDVKKRKAAAKAPSSTTQLPIA